MLPIYLIYHPMGSRSGGWSSSQILLKSIPLGFTSSASLFNSLFWSLFSSIFDFFSLSKCLEGGATYPSLGMCTTRKPGKEIQWQLKTITGKNPGKLERYPVTTQNDKQENKTPGNGTGKNMVLTSHVSQRIIMDDMRWKLRAGFGWMRCREGIADLL